MYIRAYISCGASCQRMCVRICVSEQQSLIRLLMLFLYFHLQVLELTDRLEIAYVDYQRRVHPTGPFILSTFLPNSVGCFLQPRTVQILIGKAKKLLSQKLFVLEFIGLTINIQRKNAQTTESLINGTFRVDSKPLFDTRLDLFL